MPIGPIEKLVYSDEFILPEEETREEKKYQCKVCGYIHSGDNPPEKCPLCGVGPELFEEV
jgi:rubrerythrin